LQKDLRMARRLEEIHEEPSEDLTFSSRKAPIVDAQFARAFQDYGIDIDALETAEVVERIGRSNIRRALVKGVEDWAPVHNRGLVNTDPRWKKMNEIVRQADRDEWRSQIRTASQSGDRQAWEKATRVRTSEEIGDRQALEKLADAIPMRDVAPTTLRLLGSS